MRLEQQDHCSVYEFYMLAQSCFLTFIYTIYLRPHRSDTSRATHKTKVATKAGALMEPAMTAAPDGS